MKTKQKQWKKILAVFALLGVFLSSSAHALNIASLLKDVAGDVTVVKVDGTCAANPYSNDAPCQPVRATCPAGKIPLPLKNIIPGCTSKPKVDSYYLTTNRVVNLATSTVAGSGYVECNVKSTGSWDSSTSKYYPERDGYSPLCDVKTKICNMITYTAIARCITSPT